MHFGLSDGLSTDDNGDNLTCFADSTGDSYKKKKKNMLTNKL